MGIFRDYLKHISGEELFETNLTESFKNTAIPTKILGFKEDYIINHVLKDTIDIFDKEGDHVTLKRNDPLFKIIEKIINDSETMKFYDYKKNFEHNKYYIKNDWDADFVVTKLVGNLPIDKIKKLF